MSKNFLLTRRSLFTGSAVLGGLGLLTACGGGNDAGGASNAESASALGVGEDIASLISVNPKERSELQEGGELRFPTLSLGPDFNLVGQNGNSADNARFLSAVSPLMVAGLWKSDFEGHKVPNPDFCESFESEVVDGKQTLTVKLNPNAKFNDGTPVDIEALRATAEVMGKGRENGFNIVSPGPHPFIESMEEDGDSIKIHMSQPYFPISDLFGNEAGVLHPAMNDQKVFNDGFVDNPHSEWHAGPYRVESWNSAEKVLTLVPNENWWGEKPLLERITFRQMEASAQRASFKNGEVDVVSTNTLTAYKDVEGTEGTEVRRGQRLFSGGLNMSSFRLPLEMRKAIFAAVDRKALADVRFNGLNWSEDLPGSMMLMPFSEYYEDNFGQVIDGWDAGQILEEAGYSKSGDYYQKDGKNAKFAVTIFGDDPVNNALAQTLVQQMKDAGIECTIDSQPDANFPTVVGNKEFDLTFSGYTVNSDATQVISQYYLSENNDGEGSEELDQQINDLIAIEDDTERHQKANEVERKHMEEFAMMGTVFNGPEIWVVKTQLANFGAGLFGAPSYDPTVWARIGWVKE